MAVAPGSRRIGGVHFDIDGNAGGFKREVRGAEAQAKRSNNVIQAEFRKTSAAAAGAEQRIRGMGASLIALGAAAGLGLGASVGILKNFAQAMSTVEAVTGASAAEMAALTAEARRLGATTRFSATQAAEGMTFLARAGFTANEALQSIEGTLKLAQAGGLELGRAADIASNVLSGFNLKTTETSRVVDVLAKAANSANTDVNQLGEALKFAAPTAVALGLDLEQTVAAIGKLSDAGIQGGLAGRGFQSAATKLVQDADKVREIIGPFDLAAEGLEGVVKRLVEAGITTEQVIDIFRAENLDVFTILANSAFDAEKGLGVLESKLREAGGTADTVAAKMDDNLNGAILTSVSALQELVLALGDAGATDALVTAFSGLTSLFRAAAENADIVGVAITALSLRAILPLAASYIPSALGALRALALSLVGVQTQAVAASRAVAVFGGPLTLAIAAAAAAYVYLGRSAESADEALARFNGTLQKVGNTRKEIEKDTEALASLNERLTASIEGQGEAAELAARREVQALNERITKNKELLALYETQARADLARIEVAIERDRGGLAKSLDVQFSGGLAGPASTDEALDGQIDRFLEFVRAQQDAGLTLSKFEANLLDQISAFRTYQEEARKAREQIELLGKSTGEVGGAPAPAGRPRKSSSSPTSANNTTTDPNDTLLDESEYDSPANDALARKRYANFVANREQARKAAEAKAQAEKELKDSFALSISDGLYQAITSGDWGEAVRQTFADAASRGLLNAIDAFASALVQALSEIDFGGSGGLFSTVASFFGGRAGGGDVAANQRYLVGENGPEMFVPNVSGFIAPNSTPQPITTPGGLSGGGMGNVTAQFIVQGSITEEVMPRVQQMFGEFSRNLPSAIDARVADRRKRGAF